MRGRRPSVGLPLVEIVQRGKAGKELEAVDVELVGHVEPFVHLHLFFEREGFNVTFGEGG